MGESQNSGGSQNSEKKMGRPFGSAEGRIDEEGRRPPDAPFLNLLVAISTKLSFF